MRAALLALAAAGVLDAGLWPRAGLAFESQPNVLVIVGDDHAAYALGCYGSAIAQTPNLDRLAAEGLRFERAFCQSPVCSASRQSFLTGLYPPAAGVTLLGTSFPDSRATLAERLRPAGFATAALGKMHFNNELTHGFELRRDGAEFASWLAGREREPLPNGVPMLGPWRPFREPARVWLNAESRPYPAWARDMKSSFLVEEAGGFFAARRRDRRPFFAVVGFGEPHSPFHFPLEEAGLYPPNAMPLYPQGPDDAPQVPLIFRELTDADRRGIAASYFNSVAFLDRKVGELLAALEQAELAKDTLVVYLGDHGYLLGHHGRFEKHCHFEPALRVPLILRWPGRVAAGSRIDGLVELVDLAPTILEACGLPVPGELHGRSLWPLIEGRAERWREETLSVYLENEEAMLRTERWKLIYSSGHRARHDGYRAHDPTPGPSWRLFDLERDPEELDDLARRPERAARLEAMQARLIDRLRRAQPPGAAPPLHLRGRELLDALLVPREEDPATTPEGREP